MLKRTERLIDAVMIVDLLELLENEDAELLIKRNGCNWKVECAMNGRTIIKKESGSLSGIISEILKILKGTTGVC